MKEENTKNELLKEVATLIKQLYTYRNCCLEVTNFPTVNRPPLAILLPLWNPKMACPDSALHCIFSANCTFNEHVRVTKYNR